MSPTTEPQPTRHFCFLRKRSHEVIRVQADTICDQTGYGTSFVLKRGGQVVGNVQGDVVVWWVEQSDWGGKRYCLEMPDDVVVRIAADRSEELPEDDLRARRVFRRDGEIVGTVYDPRYAYHTWWIEEESDV